MDREYGTNNVVHANESGMNMHNDELSDDKGQKGRDPDIFPTVKILIPNMRRGIILRQDRTSR